jgi:glutamate/aspartate transport system substrate-binding protein
VHATLAVLLAAALVALAASPACAQPADAPLQLTGTLAKVRDAGSITLGHRESSIPFSYLSPRGEPIGYSIDLCKLLVDAIGEAVGRTIAVKWQPVTSETRIAAVAGGQVDLECGSTTNNLERQKQVAFSPTIFVSGTKLLVRKGSPIRSFRDLGGKRVVVTAGTTNEKAMRDLAARFKIAMTLVTAPDHAASFEQLTSGKVDTFATDDVLLYGLLAQHKAAGDYVVTGEFLSYDPYGIVYRKGDAQLAKLVDDSLRQLAEDREIERRYERWFLRRLPQSGVSLDLPMSAQLETILQTLASPPDARPVGESEEEGRDAEPEGAMSFIGAPRSHPPIDTDDEPCRMRPPLAVVSPTRAAGRPAIRTVAEPVTTASGRPSRSTLSPTPAAGSMPMSTVGVPGPSTTPVAGGTCMKSTGSPTRAAEGMAWPRCLS